MALSTARPTTEMLVAADPADPFRYGWRVVQRHDADGALVWERVPLTLRDVLHPQEGDQVTRNEAHERRCRYLADVLQAQVASDPTAVVLHDVRIAWDVPDLEPHGPDIAVIVGVRQRRSGSTFDVAEEGVRPALIIEVTSPSTAGLDRSTKLEEYELARVPRYVIVDAVVGQRAVLPRLLGYQLVAGRYQPLALDGQGRLALDPVPLWLSVVAGELVCVDASGQVLGDYTAERQARAAAEARVAALEAELRSLRGERDGEE